MSNIGISDKDMKYLNSVCSHSLLSQEDEINCSKIIKKSSNEEERQDAIKKLVLHNQKLVRSIATSFFKKNDSISLMDLISAGNQGLMHSALLYDYDMFQNKFSTFAVSYIKSYILKTLYANRDIKVTPYILILYNRYLKLIDSGETDENKIFKKLNISMSVFEKVKKCKALNIIHLDSSINEDDSTFHDVIYDTEKDFVSHDTFFCDFLMNLLEELDEREKIIVKNRVLNYRDEKETLENLSSKLKITKERVRQIQNEALVKLKNKLQKMGYEKYSDFFVNSF